MNAHNRAAVQSLASTGKLPQDRFWGAMRGRHDAHPARFQAGHPVMGALLRRELAIRTGKADGRTSLFPRTPLWAHLRGRHDAHTARFGHYHPFLGKLFEVQLPRGSEAGTPETGPVAGSDTTGRASPPTASDVSPFDDAFTPVVSPFDVTFTPVQMPTTGQVLSTFDDAFTPVQMPTTGQVLPAPTVIAVPEASSMTLAGLVVVVMVLARSRTWWPRAV